MSKIAALLVVLALGLTGCGAPRPGEPTTPRCPRGARLQILPLSGPVASDRAELSGLAWHGQSLVLLSQFPERFAEGDLGPSFFTTSRAELERAIDQGGAVAPRPLSVEVGELPERIEGWGGFEAIAVRGDDAWLVIEAEQGRVGRGFLVRGRFRGDDALQLEPESLVEIPGQVEMPNLAYESALLADDRLLVFHEVNDRRLSPAAVVRVFGLDLSRGEDVPMLDIEHRVTDVTALDDERRFWLVNYRWAGDRRLLVPGMPAGPVERLVEARLHDDRVERTGRAPIELCPVGRGRNWEGIARLGDRGLLVVTDRHPATLLAFAPFRTPGQAARSR